MNEPRIHTSRAIPQTDIKSLMLCVAGGWLYGTISGGRARELAIVLGHAPEDIEDLKFVEERNAEEQRTSDHAP